jgi:hypothetical protein
MMAGITSPPTLLMNTTRRIRPPGRKPRSSCELRRAWARQGQGTAWRAYLTGLRAAHRRKRRPVETQDALACEAG